MNNMSLGLEGRRELRRFYYDHLFENILPFWTRNAVDSRYGGYYTGFANSGGELLHTHKFTWSQGRFVWVWAGLSGLIPGRTESGRYLKLARSGAEFLMENALLPNGNCSFVLSREGDPIALDNRGNRQEPTPDLRYDTSTYADCFVVYGLSEYALVSGERRPFDFAYRLYQSILKIIDAGDFRTDPYPTPPGYRQHGVPMIMLETSRQLAAACDRFDAKLAPGIRARADRFMREIMDGHRCSDRDVMIEFLSSDETLQDTMIGTYVNPGHTLECMWFILHYALEVGDRGLIGPVTSVVKRALELGWDHDHGGLFQFVHVDGGRPRGPVPEEQENHTMIKKLRSNWDAKLWWVHSEALYTLLLCYSIDGRDWIEDWYLWIHDYTFGTFPADDGTEWINVRNRDGSPSDRVVALPVKDPFHVPRALMNLIRLLDEWEKQ